MFVFFTCCVSDLDSFNHIRNSVLIRVFTWVISILIELLFCFYSDWKCLCKQGYCLMYSCTMFCYWNPLWNSPLNLNWKNPEFLDQINPTPVSKSFEHILKIWSRSKPGSDYSNSLIYSNSIWESYIFLWTKHLDISLNEDLNQFICNLIIAFKQLTAWYDSSWNTATQILYVNFLKVLQPAPSIAAV